MVLSFLNEVRGKDKDSGKAKGKKKEEMEIREDDLAEILYTSGTTGHSKGVMLSHKNIVSNTIAGIEAIRATDENSVILSVLPLAHSYGCACASLGNIYSGSRLYFLTRKPSPN